MNRNYVRLKGHLGASPEIRLTQNGDKMMQLRIATNESFRKSDGSWNQKTQWHHVQVFNQGLIQQAESKLLSGDFVLIEGMLEYVPRETPMGEKFKKAVVIVRRYGTLERLEPRGSNEDSQIVNFSSTTKESTHETA